MKRIADSIKTLGSFIKFSHTLFAMPFAISSMVIAAREHHGWPGWKTFVLIIAAMVTARTSAMVFNRIVDRKFDAANPRTAKRELPAGKISLFTSWIIWLISSFLFLVVSYLLNKICFYLAPVALFVICFYSFTKRFTDFTHFFLGLALGLSPIGAWLAVTGKFSFTPIFLGIIVILWLVGFDIIYSIQDYEFDRTHGLHSIVVRWGIKNALIFAFLVHMIMWGLLFLFGVYNRFRFPYLVGCIIILISLLLEHWLARIRSLKWINLAFFRLNALISIVFMVSVIAEIQFPGFRLRF